MIEAILSKKIMIAINQSLVETVIAITKEANKAISNIYQQDFSYSQKDDRSPVTEADIAAHRVIVKGLKSFNSQIPIISEEQASISYDERKSWDCFWLVDPLDGTKEFIKKNGEFTVNIALIYKGNSVFGMISLPVTNVIYFGYKEKGSFKIDPKGHIQPIESKSTVGAKIVVARSRSHSEKKEEIMLSCFKEIETIHVGSSLKFCYIAEGKADIYIRGGPTMEWDTAAGQAIAESAGTIVRDLEGKKLVYNKKILKNPGFICCANRELFTKVQEGQKCK